jgi:hypothetical protein
MVEGCFPSIVRAALAQPFSNELHWTLKVELFLVKIYLENLLEIYF